jgi:hypothetical protein
VIDEMMPMVIKDQRLRARGKAPKLSDSEVITMEVVGSYLGLSQDQELFDHFRSASLLENQGHSLASPVTQSACPLSRSLSESSVGARSVSHRYRLWAIDGSLWHEARLGTGSLALAQSLVVLHFDADALFSAQSARTGSLPSI